MTSQVKGRVNVTGTAMSHSCIAKIKKNQGICMASRQNSEFSNIFYTVAFILLLVLFLCGLHWVILGFRASVIKARTHYMCSLYVSTSQVEVLGENNDKHRNLKIALIKPRNMGTTVAESGTETLWLLCGLSINQ